MKFRKIFYGWWIVAAVFFISAFANDVVFQSFTAVFEPIAAEFKWSYAKMSFAASRRGFETPFLGPLVGFLFDRYGPRSLPSGPGPTYRNKLRRTAGFKRPGFLAYIAGIYVPLSGREFSHNAHHTISQ
jgi:hypothetical protein